MQMRVRYRWTSSARNCSLVPSGDADSDAPGIAGYRAHGRVGLQRWGVSDRWELAGQTGCCLRWRGCRSFPLCVVDT